jgi:hypothetical protein
VLPEKILADRSIEVGWLFPTRFFIGVGVSILSMIREIFTLLDHGQAEARENCFMIAVAAAMASRAVHPETCGN